MALVKPVIFQIAGYQDSGKTTAMMNLIARLSIQGYQVATIKHHGHGGKPDLSEKKDSGRHVKAGALASLIEGDGRVLLQAEKQGWDIQEQLKILSVLSPDIVLIEGHKHEGFPKAVLLRDEHDLHLLDELTNIKMAAWREPKAGTIDVQTACPLFSEMEEAYSWIEDYLKQEAATLDN
ncbi:molybdopterin-guanine dinucleotide biosynthesis protein B [Bacillus sp. FJAT-27251]|uniref:molybdopterin-guanine dinucleotide biosynthesis protein B n=1 Tax=Bacillus sp. FJAT-27251 TaxID=1684142 RepID=UPI0006A7F02C|nr:molybdopterin-guanine dinucleotide biosynthesis protein B [Bacillus sp. FJAT-27251]